MIANWTLSIISCYLACFAHRFSSYVAFFSRTSAGSLPRARARVLAGLMPQGSVLPLDLIGIEGARVFRKNMLRYDDPSRKNKNFDFCATFLRLRTPFRPLQGGNGPPCVRFAAFSGFNPRFDAPRQFAIAKKLQFRAYFCFWAPGSAPCWCRGRGVPGAAPLWTTWAAFCPLWSRAFSLAASAGALALIPSQRQLHCGIMIRTVSKEL